ncbi:MULTISPECIES: septation ring formation regulator EzrA [unclassified Lactobacillus]|uniref:septation ring formation regulator EzrA n=1 Tax=unclassified Lactobacillus TaxID=2620435 RepID=UPI000EFA424A|nr:MULTISPECIES: septation ring formation regulator EzrA [unclassified Lactobacillus]RMC25086.1 septation ring formation regulator EzrA [Lactobacillus sp. ESL0247]RMC29241.1 septation ring formation regulator EzrA [Lactobacillus sp. ESL0246]RMC32261.1 septation ring formation regulator EzrA [Lactobacillus sp. ESL0245]
MSPTQSIVVIIAILIIIVIIAFMLIVNRRQLHEIIELDELINRIAEMHLETDIINLDKMDLAGESLTTLTTWRKNYQQAANNKIPHVQKLVEQSAEQNAHYHLIKAHKQIKQAQEIMQPTYDDAKNTKEVFTELLESNRENKMQYDDLIKNYQEIRKLVLADSFEYGVALDQLENELTNLENDFSEAKSLTAQGDQVEAKRVLSKIKMSLSSINSLLPKIRSNRHLLDTVFQDQLSELADSYKKMVSSKYYITEIDVLDEVKQIRKQVDAADKLLANLKIDELNQQVLQIKSRISNLYDILTKEYKARPFVEENQDKIQRLLAHEQVESKKLVEKLRHIDESYELTHGELATSRKLEQEINDMNRQYTVDTQNLADGKGVYSSIKASWLSVIERLREISAEQQTMSKDVDGLFDSENVANDSINRFKQEVSLVYRRLERKKLPGNPDSFIQMYTLVVNEIGHVAKELSQVRLNMEKISNELIQISDDVERLKREADDIINSADLVELTLQYANKYSTNAIVKSAQQKTMKLYSQEYNYKEALDTIATAIEKAEPGSYQRLENLYYSEKKNN